MAPEVTLLIRASNLCLRCETLAWEPLEDSAESDEQPEFPLISEDLILHVG